MKARYFGFSVEEPLKTLLHQDKITSAAFRNFKGATKCIIPVWSLFYSVRVYKSLHFLPILLVKLGFRLSMFQFFVFLFLYLCSFALCFELNVLIDFINNMIVSLVIK